MIFLGYKRKVDNLGRVVIPIELRRHLDIKDNVDELMFFIESDGIVIKKACEMCVFCGDEKNVIAFKGKNICPMCAKELTL